MKEGLDLVALATELQRQQESKRDFVADTRQMVLLSDKNAPPALMLDKQQFPINAYATKQLAEWAGVPAAYYDRMRNNAPELLGINVNHWLREQPAERMVRTLDGNVRAFLSNRYRRIDNYDLAEAVLPILRELEGARVESCAVTERKLHIKIVTPRIQAEVSPGDMVQAGVVISNSEIGDGALSVMPLIYRLVCRNGMIAAQYGQRRAHLGRAVQVQDGAEELFRDETLIADDRALLMKIADVTRAAVSEAGFATIVDSLREAKGDGITGNPVKAVEVLAKRLAFTENDKTGILRHLIQGSELTRYGLVQAVTAYSQDVADYDRATDFERAGGQLLELPKEDWREIATAQ